MKNLRGNGQLNRLNQPIGNPKSGRQDCPHTGFLAGRWIGAAAALAFLFARPAFAQEKRGLYGSVPPEALRSLPVGVVPSSQRLDLAISLPLRNQATLDYALQELYNPASPYFHQWLTSEQFTELFGPTEQDVEKVVQFAQAHGLTVTEVHTNRMIVDVSGSAAAVEEAFNVRMVLRRHPTENRNYFAPDVAPSVEADVPILDVCGLDNFILPRPRHHLQTVSNATGSSPGGGYMGNDLRAAYAPGVSLDGTGQVIGLFEFTTAVYSSDISSYCTTAGIPQANITYVLLDGLTTTPTGDTGEQSLDVEVAHSLAPGASIYFYLGNNAIDIFNRIASDNIAKSASCSFGVSPPPSTLSQVLQQMAAQGQSMYNASGDSGFGSAFGWDDNPYMTQVGGTVLTTTGAGGPYKSEVGWNGSGGNISTSFSIPTWQQGIDMTACGGSTTMRNTPDVAMVSDSLYFVYHNTSGPASGLVGGTSASAPEWAGFTALINQQAAAHSKPTAGFINPQVYSILKGTGNGAYASCLHDITTGNNGKPAVVGYDLVTGVGTPTGQQLINALSGFIVGSPGITVSSSASSLTIPQAASGQCTITVAPLNGFGGSVSLSASGLPSGVTASFNPASVNVTSNTSPTSTLTFTASSTAAVGTATVTVTGTSGGVTGSTTISLTIYNPSANISANLSSAFNRSSAIVVDGSTFTGGFDNVGAACSWNLLGSFVTNNGVIYTTGPTNAADDISGAGQTVSLPAGSYTSLNFLGAAVNGNQASQNFVVHYSDGTSTTFTQSLSDWFTPQNYSGESTAATMPYRDSSNGSRDNRTFYLYSYSLSVNSSKTVSSITLPNNGNVEILAITLIAAGGGSPDFSLSAAPSSLTVNQGSSGTSTITVNPLNGFTGSVSLSASGLPSGVTATFNPQTTTSTSTLTLTASSTATTGTTTVTVTGTSGSLTHTTTISLTVASSGLPAAPSNLTAAAGKKSVTINWVDNSSNETGFKVERSTDGVNFNQITTTGANVTSYKNTGLTSGTTYYYRVRATNGAGDSAYSNIASATAK
jgi:subtilase family serine protease